MSAKNKESLKQQMEALQALLAWFDQADVDLEEALVKFKEADAIARQIEERVGALQNEVTVLKQRFEQESTTSA